MRQSHTTQCLIVGGCSAGLMLGVLLARAGVSVRLLEKHADFLRDFRGEMIHRSTKEAAADWPRALRFERSEMPAPINVRPPADNAVGPYTFHPLTCGAPLVAEGARMKNCLATYAWDYVRGSGVWSIQRDGVPVADMELAFGGTRHGVQWPEQLYAASYDEAPDEVWVAAYQWLARWAMSEDEIVVTAADDVIRRAAARHAMSQPYWEAKGPAAGAGVPLPLGCEPYLDDMIRTVQPFACVNQRRS